MNPISQRVKTTLFSFFGLLVVTLGYLPTLHVPTRGDDFYLQFEAQGRTNGNLGEWLHINFIGAITNGHFKPVGNFVDSFFQFLAYPLSNLFGVSTRYYFFLGGLFFLMLLVVISTFAIKNFFALYSFFEFKKSNIFILLSSVTAATLQIHIWTHDPVTNYLPTGMGSAVIGIGILALIAKILKQESSRKRTLNVWIASVLGICAVLYYEMLISALIAETFLIFIAYFQLANSGKKEKIFLFRLFGAVVALPGFIFVIGRAFSKIFDSGSTYSGTQIELSLSGMKTFLIGLLSILPGGSWYSITTKIESVNISWQQFALAALICFLIGANVSISVHEKIESIFRSRQLAIPAIALLILAGTATASHAFTPKYILEILDPSMVYLYYSIASMSVNMILVGVILIVFAKYRLVSLRILAVLGIAVFGMMQNTINWTLSNDSRSSNSMNTVLMEASTDGSISRANRCEAMDNWIESGWPDNGMAENLERTYNLFHNQPFCK